MREMQVKGYGKKGEKWLQVVITAILTVMLILPAFSDSYGVTDSSSGSTTTKVVPITTGVASGQTNRRLGVVVRKSASSKSKRVTRIPNNAKITMSEMVFTSTKSSSRKHRWFYIQYKNYKGYVPVNQVDHVRYQYKTIRAKNTLTVRKGAGTKMKRVRKLAKGTKLNVCLKTRAKGSKTVWYRFRYGKKFYFVCSKDLVMTETITVPVEEPATDADGMDSDISGATGESDQVTLPAGVDPTVLQSNAKPMSGTMPQSTLTTWYNSLIKMADQIEKNNLKYNTSGGGTTYAAGLKAKKVNCATYISWAMQQAGFEKSGFCFYLGYGKIYDQKIPKNYFITSPNYLVQTNLNMKLSDCVKKGYLKPGDIVGRQGKYHTMVYKHVKNGKYYFFSVGPKSVANKTIRENSYAPDYKIGVIIRRIA
ncbi:MAG: hypothetical protein Q4C18_02855 [Eubacteriales bacterium]|nr:hypothetical protein [Eubacteriales bacterium]